MTCDDCPRGPPCCAHSFVCSCETFVRLRYCSHLHVVIANCRGSVSTVGKTETSVTRRISVTSSSADDLFRTKLRAVGHLEDLLQQVKECEDTPMERLWLKKVVGTAEAIKKK